MKQPTNKFTVFFSSATGKLASSYLAIITILTILFSVVIFAASTAQFSRPPGPPHGPNNFSDMTRQNVESLFRQRADQTKMRLFWSLVLLDIITISGGAFLSFVLARKTLAPIESAMQAQSQFVSDASHELRTPLTAMQTMGEVALRRKRLLISDAKETIRGNVEEVKKMRDLTDALLVLASSENNGFVPQPTNIADTSATSVAEIKPLAAEKHITIQSTITSAWCVVDPKALSIIMKIVLENAVKFSPEQSTIYVHNYKHANFERVEIRDEGPGIAPEFHQKVFERFYRIDSSRSVRNSSGYGLGLAIAKQIGEKSGLEISVSSNGKSGTTFYLDIKSA